MKTRDLLYVGLFAALTAVGAFIRIPFAFSAFTLQFFFTVMAGLLLGPKKGALSQLVYVALGLFGLPIFTSGGGLGYLLYPTFGFLLGLIPAAWVTGALSRGRRGLPQLLPACIAGMAVLYLFGLPYMALILNVYLGKGLSLWAIGMAGMFPFLPGDLVKIFFAVVLSQKLARAVQIRPVS